MRYWVYDEDGILLRKFWDKESAQQFLQDGWKLVVQDKPKQIKPTVETHGEALW